MPRAEATGVQHRLTVRQSTAQIERMQTWEESVSVATVALKGSWQIGDAVTIVSADGDEFAGCYVESFVNGRVFIGVS